MTVGRNLGSQSIQRIFIRGYDIVEFSIGKIKKANYTK